MNETQQCSYIIKVSVQGPYIDMCFPCFPAILSHCWPQSLHAHFNSLQSYLPFVDTRSTEGRLGLVRIRVRIRVNDPRWIASSTHLCCCCVLFVNV